MRLLLLRSSSFSSCSASLAVWPASCALAPALCRDSSAGVARKPPHSLRPVSDSRAFARRGLARRCLSGSAARIWLGVQSAAAGDGRGAHIRRSAARPPHSPFLRYSRPGYWPEESSSGPSWSDCPISPRGLRRVRLSEIPSAYVSCWACGNWPLPTFGARGPLDSPPEPAVPCLGGAAGPPSLARSMDSRARRGQTCHRSACGIAAPSSNRNRPLHIMLRRPCCRADIDRRAR